MHFLDEPKLCRCREACCAPTRANSKVHGKSKIAAEIFTPETMTVSSLMELMSPRRILVIETSRCVLPDATQLLLGAEISFPLKYGGSVRTIRLILVPPRDDAQGWQSMLFQLTVSA